MRSYKNITITNIGKKDISSVGYLVEVDESSKDLIRDFNTSCADANKSGKPLLADNIKQCGIYFSLKKPSIDRELRFNITVRENETTKEWHDYITMKVSKYPHMKLYFASKNQELNGILVAPGRTLINVKFKKGGDSYAKIPLKLDDEYQVVISSPDVAKTDQYILSTEKKPDISRFSIFDGGDPLVFKLHEPNNNIEEATNIALLGGEEIGFIGEEDIDFYKLTDMVVLKKTYGSYNIANNLFIQFYSPLNSYTLTDNILLKNNDGTIIDSIISYDDKFNMVIINPTNDLNISENNYKLELLDGLKSSTDSGFCKDSNKSFELKVTNSSLLKTGQTISYIKGDDGNYQKGIDPIFLKYSIYIVVDKLQNLMWQDQRTEIKLCGKSADYCEALTLGGYDDWRLPTIQEFESIFDYYSTYNYNAHHLNKVFDYSNYLGKFISKTSAGDDSFFGIGRNYLGQKIATTDKCEQKCIREIK